MKHTDIIDTATTVKAATAQYRIKAPVTDTDVAIRTGGGTALGSGIGNIASNVLARGKGLKGKAGLALRVGGTIAGGLMGGGTTFGVNKGRQTLDKMRMKDYARMGIDTGNLMDFARSKAASSTRMQYQAEPPKTNLDILLSSLAMGGLGAAGGSAVGWQPDSEGNRSKAHAAIGALLGGGLLGGATYGAGKLGQKMDKVRMRQRQDMVDSMMGGEAEDSKGEV